MFYMHEKCKISDFYVFQGNAATHEKFSALCSSERILQIYQELITVIAMVRVAPFFNSECI